MKLTEEQIKFLEWGCDGKWTLTPDGKVDVDGSFITSEFNLTEIPVKFGNVTGNFNCTDNNLTTLENCPDFVGSKIGFDGNNLTEYFKSIKEKDFPHWDKLYWGDVIREYPFLINLVEKYSKCDDLPLWMDMYPLTKLYYKD